MGGRLNRCHALLFDLRRVSKTLNQLFKRGVVVRKIGIVLVAVLLTMLTGCALPPVQKVTQTKGSKIGYYIKADNNLMRTNQGKFLGFQSSEEFPYDMNMRAELAKSVEKIIQKRGFVPFDISQANLVGTDINRLYSLGNGKYEVRSGQEELLRHLKEDLGITAVIVIEEGQVRVHRECYLECHERFTYRSGLYSEHLLLKDFRYMAVAAYNWEVYSLEPFTKLSRAPSLQTSIFKPVITVPGLKLKDEDQKLTEPEAKLVRDSILKFVERTAYIAISLLNPK